MPINIILRYLFAVSLTVLFPGAVLAYDFASPNPEGDTIYYNVLSDRTAEVTYKSIFSSTPSYSGRIKVPSVVEHSDRTYEVIGIGERAFFDCRGLEKVTLSEKITTVGKWAFAWCDALSSISLPSSLKNISADAFDGCYSLTEFNTSGHGLISPDGVLFSSDGSSLIAFPPAFEGRYDIPAATKTISDRAFGGCTFLTEVSIPQYTRSIGTHAFYYCSWLKTLDIPASVDYIGDAAFADCSSLARIDVSPANGKYASLGGWLYDKDFTTLLQCPGGASDGTSMPSTVLNISKYAFFRNLGMTTLIIPEGVNIIGDGAFLDCQSMESLQLPSTIKKIGSMALAMCPSLRAIYTSIPDPDAVEMGEGVFAETDVAHCTLYVPKGAIMKYRKAPQWCGFKHVYEYDNMQEQSISWYSQPDSIDKNTLNVPLMASSSSGLPVKYHISPQSDGFGYISGDTLVITHPGEMAVTAFQIGSNTFYPASPVTHVFRIAQAGIQSPEIEDVKVYGGIGRISIKGTEGNELIRVFSVNGMLIYSGYDTEVPVNMRGIYVVAVRNRPYKVVVR